MSKELADIMNTTSEEIMEEAAQNAKPDNFDEMCEKYLELQEKIKPLEKEFEALKAKLKKGGDQRSDKYQVIITETEAFRMKGLKVFEEKGYTKEKIIQEGIGGMTASKRLGVSKIG